MSKIFINNNILFKKAKFAKNFFEKLLGLMFQKKPQEFDALIFKNAFWIHSCFVFFNFSAAYLDKDFKVTKIDKNIKPFCFLKPVFGTKYIVEYWREEEIKNGDIITFGGKNG